MLMLNKIKLNAFSKTNLSIIKTLMRYTRVSFTTTTETEYIPKPCNKKFKILFFGNDDISLATLGKMYEEIYQDNSVIESLGVVTTPLENKKSVQSSFHKFINDKNIEKFELNIKTEDLMKSSWREISTIIKEKQFDTGIVASFGKMIPGSVITSFRNGAFVMHPSLLPKFRGASPIQHALLNKEKKTGVSLVETSIGKFDAGDILLQREVNIESFYRFKELALVLSRLGAESTIEFLKNFDQLLKNKKSQLETEATKARLILETNFVYLDFNRDSADNILTLYKSFFGSQLEPYTKANIDGRERFIFFENLCLVTINSEIYKLVLSKVNQFAKPGDLFWDLKHDRNNIYIKSASGWLVTSSVKMDGLSWTPGEKIITKVLMNKRFTDKTSRQMTFSTLPKKVQVVKPIPL